MAATSPTISLEDALTLLAAARDRREAADRQAARALDDLRLAMRIARIAGARTGQIATHAGMTRQRVIKVIGPGR